MIHYQHRAGNLYWGDALQLLAALPDDSIDLIATDPPYRVISGGNGPSSKWHQGVNGSILAANDGKIFRHNDVAISDYMPQFFRVLKPGTHCYVMINNLNLRELLNVAADCGFGFHNLLRWDKNTANANRWYMKDCEYTGFFYKKPAKSINRPGDKQGFASKTLRGPDKLHPTQKPIDLMTHYVTNSSDPGAVVLDPFAGAGSTLIAAAESERCFIGCELDPAYYLSAIGRLQGV